jgi:DNA invertase Pin-like site-specific DNA recombinase
VVTKLDQLARSLLDARDILAELTTRNVKLSLDGSIHDPTDPVGRLLSNVLTMVAEFEADLIRLPTREGMQVAKAKGQLPGQAAEAEAKPGRAHPRAARPRQLHPSRLAELFGVGSSTIYPTLDRVRPAPPEPERPFAHLDRS